MSRLTLYFPVEPYRVNRAWGVTDPAYEAFGFLRHNGVDLALREGQEIRAPLDCRVVKIDIEPEGSGLYVCLLSRGMHTFDDGVRARVELTFMHLSSVVVTVGTNVSVGDLIAHGGASGNASGSHTHLAPKRVSLRLFGGYRDRDQNDAGNTFDPEPYWNQMTARSRQQ